MDRGGSFIRRPSCLYIYMKDVACVLLIERDGKAAITAVILSMTTKIFIVDSK